MELTVQELDLVRQWFNAAQDAAPEYLDDADRALMGKIMGAIKSRAGSE